MENLFLTSDHHFNHKNIIKYCNRPFSSVEEMNEALIENWNKVVKPLDSVYYLGDFSFGSYEQTLPIFNRLNGVKTMVAIGNHDAGNVKRLPWNSQITKYTYLPYKAEHHYLSHYPTDVMVEADVKKFKPKYYFHGHCHGTGGTHRNKLDVGVDCWNYAPVNIDTLIQKIKDTPCF